MEGKLIVGVVSIVVGIILVGSMLAPAIQMVSGGAWDETVTTTYNEDPDLTFDRLTSDFALNITVTFGDDISIVNGEDTVTATSGPMFLLAADNSAVFINTADEIILVWTDTDGTQSVDLQGDFTAVIADDKLTIDDGTSYDLPLPTSYLYVPSSTGQYGSFPDGELTKRAEDPVIAAGSFAGVVGYNTSVTLVGDAMQMEVVGNDTTITEVNWIKAVEELDPQMIDFDPGQITIQPLDPSVIDPIDNGGNSVMSAPPTPSYTDGDWGYNLYSSNTKAKIVSYSGTAGDLVIPSEVGGYPVIQVGIGTSQGNVFDTTLSDFTLTIPSSVNWINSYAFSGCTGLTSVTIPDSVTNLADSSFYGCTGLTSVTIPGTIQSIQSQSFKNCTGLTSVTISDGVKTIGNNAFNSCTGLTSIIIPESITSIGASSFYSSGIKEVLNFSSVEITTTSNGLNADAVQDYFDAEAYIAPATITEVIHHGGGSGEYSGFYEIILVVTVVGILVAAAGLMIYRRSL